MTNAWRGFRGDHWRDDVNVRDFVQQNYTLMTATNRSSPNPLTLPANSGDAWPNFKRKNAPGAACST